jgi:hypothetical protein
VGLETEAVGSPTVTRLTEPVFADKQNESDGPVRLFCYLVVLANQI